VTRYELGASGIEVEGGHSAETSGGALRKRRRGEVLTSEEEAALTRWQRLSQWRKAIAIGAFALGTFGLGFTLGGIVFSRRGKREAV